MKQINFANKIPIKINYTNIKTSTNRSSNKNKVNKEKKHSKIFNYEGLRTAVSKYNSLKLENKYINTDLPIKPNKNNIDNDIKINDNKENMKSISKLKEMNNNMDVILTGLKDNLDNLTANKGKKYINLDNFMKQIDDNKDNSLLSDKIINNLDKESLDNSFFNMSISNFNFEIKSNKKFYFDINNLKEEEKIKLKYIYDNNCENILYLDEIINNIYDYKNKFESLKNKSNNLNLSQKIDENYFNDIIKKRFKLKEIEYNNEIIRNEINILIENLNKSFYNGDLLLNRYYNKLNQIDINVQNNIDGITNDVLK